MIYNRQIKPYLPELIFDAHTHLLINAHYSDLSPIVHAADPLLCNIDMTYLQQWWSILFPDSNVHGLVMGFPIPECKIQNINQYVAEHVSSADRFSILVHPKMMANELEKQILRYKPAGLKPYMCFAQVPDIQQAGILDMIPEHQVALADKHNLSITLHVSKPKGMADSDNLADIKYLVEKYPNCNFILAHCGRCFITPNMEEAVSRIPIAPNLWVDTSAVCDIGVFKILFDGFNRNMILFGTDLVTAAGFRGTYVPIGMNWQWVTAKQLNPLVGKPIEATFAAYENIRAMLYAAKFCQLKKIELENIFYNNAVRLFNL